MYNSEQEMQGSHPGGRRILDSEDRTEDGDLGVPGLRGIIKTRGVRVRNREDG